MPFLTLKRSYYLLNEKILLKMGCKHGANDDLPALLFRVYFRPI